VTDRGRVWRGALLAVSAAVWLAAAAYLWRTEVPALHLSGFDAHRYFTARELSRARSFANGERLLWLLATVAPLVALVVLNGRARRFAPAIGLGRVSTAIVVGMVTLVTLWFVALPFGLADLWWQHHWGLGPFDVGGWLASQWATIGSEAVSVTAAIALAVGLAAKLGHRWWIAGAPAFAAIFALFAFVGGWAGAAGSHPIRDPGLRARVARIEHAEGVSAAVRVLPVHTWTSQANAFTAGFGPSTHVVIWDTLLDGRFSPGEVDVVVAHELGHVRSRHILKSLGWFVLLAFPLAYLVELGTRRRGGLANPANIPLALLVLSLALLALAPLQNAVSRRYEAEADWHALLATHDPASMTRLFQTFGRTSLEEPNPPLLDYLWLENHPTLMQRIAMAERFRQGAR
jgi:STE24 endopeptidase